MRHVIIKVMQKVMAYSHLSIYRINLVLFLCRNSFPKSIKVLPLQKEGGAFIPIHPCEIHILIDYVCICNLPACLWDCSY